MTCSHLVECLRKRKGIYPVVLEREYHSDHLPQYALDYNKNNFYHSLEPPYNTLTIDFMTNVSISSYEISSGSNVNWLVNWNMAISNNYYEWTTIDVHDNDKPPSEYGKINLPYSYKARFVRFNGTKTFDKNQFFVVYFVKFYGTILRTCHSLYQNKKIISNNRLFSFLCIIQL